MYLWQRSLKLTLLALVFLNLHFLISAEDSSKAKWWKGNLHTHSLWSDGDDFPEMIVNWYVEHGYNFLALSDHNILSEGNKWIMLSSASKTVKEAYQKYLSKFGHPWVESREDTESGLSVRLKPLDEFRSLFESPSQFLLMQGEEITARYVNLPVHLNATNLKTIIPPQTGQSVQEVIRKNVDAVYQQREETGRPILVHLNHPNFGWAITAKDIAEVEKEKFFEVYNGHPAVRNYGDQDHMSTEKMWDYILTYRLTKPEKSLIYGLATDDAHNYHDYQTSKSNPGRGWVMVKSAHLTAESIIYAIEKGDFYASTGVYIESIQSDQNSYNITIQPENGVTYRTQFIGVVKEDIKDLDQFRNLDMKDIINHQSIGKILSTQSGTKVSYQFQGNEIYVRAKVISSKLQENPYSNNDFESAWLQPIDLN